MQTVVQPSGANELHYENCTGDRLQLDKFKAHSTFTKILNISLIY